MTGMGLNLDGLFITQEHRQRAYQYIQSVKPKTVLVLNDLPTAETIKKMSPTTEVIFRKTFGEHSDNLYREMTPQRWWAEYEPAHKLGLTLHTCNEPSVNGQMVEFELACAQIALQNKARVVLGNFSVGTPDLGVYPTLAPLLEVIVNNPTYLRLGLHEYSATNWYYDFDKTITDYEKWKTKIEPSVKPYLVGRYRWINDYCQKKWGKLPSIILTEWGFDTIYSATAWQSTVPQYQIPMGIKNCIPSFASWKTNLNSWEAYAVEQLHRQWIALYADAPNILGQCYFCVGGHGVWGDVFNIAQYPLLMELLKARDFSSTGTSIGGGIQNMQLGKLLRPIEYTGGNVRFRVLPTTSANTINTIVTGQEGWLFTDSYALSDGYQWRRGLFSEPNGALVVGWFALVTGQETWHYLDIASGSIDLTHEIALSEELTVSLKAKNGGL